jgi:Methyltransferase FkbM domain
MVRPNTTKHKKVTFRLMIAALIVFVSWIMLSSTRASDSSNGGEEAGEVPARSLASIAKTRAKDDEVLRWKKYKNVYHYEPPSNSVFSVAPECGLGPTFASFFDQGRDKRSRYIEDKIIYRSFFKERLTGTGTYVEIGAFDGQSESNSRFFDICLGWKGLLIEGNPSTYIQTVSNRPQAHRMSFAPSCKEDSTVQFYNIPMTNAGLEGKAITYNGKSTVSVPCGPLGPVLEDIFRGETINFFSLDVEGVESQVLETIDFEKVKIDVLMVEVDNYFCKKDCELRDNVRAIMKKAGYIRPEGLVRASDIYLHPRATFSLIRGYTSPPDPGSVG